MCFTAQKLGLGIFLCTKPSEVKFSIQLETKSVKWEESKILESFSLLLSQNNNM